MKNFLEKFIYITSIILAITGIISLPKDFNLFPDKNESFSYLIGISILTIIILFSLIKLIKPSFFRKFGLKRYKVKHISVIENKKIIDISKKYKATITTNLKIIYSELPTKDELVDVMECEPNVNVNDFYYKSKDSNVISKIQKRKNRIAVYWKPKSEIIPNQPYSHHIEYKSPSNYGPNLFWHGFHIDKSFGNVEMLFKAKTKFVKAFAFSVKSNKSMSDFNLYKYGFKKELRNSTEPILNKNNNTIEWNLSNPESGKFHILVGIYENGEEIFIEKMQRKNWLQQSTVVKNK
jgi:hypothetical protein